MVARARYRPPTRDFADFGEHLVELGALFQGSRSISPFVTRDLLETQRHRALHLRSGKRGGVVTRFSISSRHVSPMQRVPQGQQGRTSQFISVKPS